MTNKEMLMCLIIISLATLLTRFLPFLIFPEGKKIPDFVSYLGQTLPKAAMGLLLVYALKGTNLSASPHGLPEILALLMVFMSYKWKKNSLLSIALATIAYMLMVQIIF